MIIVQNINDYLSTPQLAIDHSEVPPHLMRFGFFVTHTARLADTHPPNVRHVFCETMNDLIRSGSVQKSFYYVLSRK